MMDELIKQRIVGAGVLSVLAILLLPWLFGDPADPRSSIHASFSGTPVPVAVESPTSTAAPVLLTSAAPQDPQAVRSSASGDGAEPSSTPKPVARRKDLATAAPEVESPARWILQLASYRSQKAADEFVARLTKDGHPAYRESISIQGKPYFRVRMALQEDSKQARQTKKKLEQKYRLQAQLFAAR